MCTTMRRLRRGTPEGTARKTLKRRLTQRIESLNKTMLEHDSGMDVAAYIEQIAALNRMRKLIIW